MVAQRSLKPPVLVRAQVPLPSINNGMSSTYCVMPFIGNQFNSNGTVSPCCRYFPDLDPAYHGPWLWSDFDNYWNQTLVKLRNDLLNNIKSPGCYNCWRDESQNVKSYRQWVNEQCSEYANLTKHLAVPIFQYYGFGNYCNLKCIMCHPSLSSSIETEYNQFADEYSKLGKTWFFDNSPKWFRAAKFLEFSEKIVQTAKIIHLTGGEPFLTPEYILLLNKIKSPSEVELIITTNLTNFNNNTVELLKQFKKVSLIVSLDGVDAHAEYIRFGCSWRDIVKNIEIIKSNNLNFIVSHTAQHISLYSFIDLIKFCDTQNCWLNIDMLTRPYELSLNSATDEEKNKFLNRLSSLVLKTELNATVDKMIDLVQQSVYDEQLNQMFWKYIGTIDKIRKVNFNKVFNN